MVASSGRTKNLLVCAGKTVPESAAAGWGVRSKRIRRRSRLGGGGGGGSAAVCSRGRPRVGGDAVGVLELQGLRREVVV